MGKKVAKKPSAPARPSLEATLIAKEYEMAQAYKDRDLNALEGLMAEEFLGVALTPDGEPFVCGRSQMAGALVTVGIDEFEIKQPRIMGLSTDAVLISYFGRIVSAMGTFGGPISSVWVKRRKEWKNIFWQITPNMKESFREK